MKSIIVFVLLISSFTVSAGVRLDTNHTDQVASDYIRMTKNDLSQCAEEQYKRNQSNDSFIKEVLDHCEEDIKLLLSNGQSPKLISFLITTGKEIAISEFSKTDKQVQQFEAIAKELRK